jgi:hypothetical protein
VLPGPRKFYIEAAEEIRARAGRECNPAAKELLLDIERSFQRLAEIARCFDELVKKENMTDHLPSLDSSEGDSVNDLR